MDCSQVNLKKGSTGDLVKSLQKFLSARGYYTGCKIDGKYGDYTVKGVTNLQKSLGLTADGWFGPKTCTASGFINNTITTTGKWTSAFQSALKKTVSTMTDVWNALPAGGHYSQYLNDKKSNAATLNAIAGKDGVNCTDISQLLYRISIEMGYKARFYRLEVKCTNGKWYGHVIIEVLGHEFENWTIIDGAARLELGNKRKIGDLICTHGDRNWSENPAWLTQAVDMYN